MTTRHIWACKCGAEAPCEPHDTFIGAVFQCPSCKNVYGCVYPRGGGKAWVLIGDNDVKFHRLLDEPEAEE